MKQAHVLSLSESTKRGCCFEEYNKDCGEMCECGITPIAKIGNNYICISHVVDVLAHTPALDMYDVSPNGAKFGAAVQFKEDFLKLCKIENEKREAK